MACGDPEQHLSTLAHGLVPAPLVHPSFLTGPVCTKPLGVPNSPLPGWLYHSMPGDMPSCAELRHPTPSITSTCRPPTPSSAACEPTGAPAEKCTNAIELAIQASHNGCAKAFLPTAYVHFPVQSLSKMAVVETAEATGSQAPHCNMKRPRPKKVPVRRCCTPDQDLRPAGACESPR